MKKYQLLSENFQFLEVIFSIFVNRRVFVIARIINLKSFSFYALKENKNRKQNGATMYS